MAVTFALLALSCAGAAGAQDKPPAPDASSVEQYVELIPTANGATAPGVRREQRFPLPPAARRALGKTSRSTANALAIVATSSTYGALPTAPNVRPALRGVDASSRDRPLRAMVAAAAPTSQIRMIALFLLLVAIVVAGAALSVRRRF